MRQFQNTFLVGKKEAFYVIPSQQLSTMKVFIVWYIPMSLGRDEM